MAEDFGILKRYAEMSRELDLGPAITFFVNALGEAETKVGSADALGAILAAFVGAATTAAANRSMAFDNIEAMLAKAQQLVASTRLAVENGTPLPKGMAGGRTSMVTRRTVGNA
ncbi:MAG TPA: hypothetical protein VD995_03180 [Azospirillum sp.]|nr:hypothetical protein [Azospirillum sp.]